MQVSTRRAPRYVRETMLALRLNADVMNYTPRSHRGSRAARILAQMDAQRLDRIEAHIAEEARA